MLQLEGRNPVYEALKISKPEKILISKKAKEDPKIQQIISIARKKRIAIEFIETSQLNKISKTKRHQGVLALMKGQESISLNQILKKEDNELCLLLLDRVQDPMNLGSILRTAEATGVKGIVIPKKGGVSLTPTVLRTSMGAGLRVPIVKKSLYQAVKLLKEEGVNVIGVDPTGTEEYYDERLTGPIAFVLGSEGGGISPTLLGKCDSVVRIPMVGNIKSLNVGVATAIVLYERLRQQNKM